MHPSPFSVLRFRFGIIELFSLGGLFSHCRPRDGTLENSCFQSFKLAHVYELIVLGWIKEKLSREYRVVYNGKQTAQAKEVYYCRLFVLFVGINSNSSLLIAVKKF